jgi:hypothetical protein
MIKMIKFIFVIYIISASLEPFHFVQASQTIQQQSYSQDYLKDYLKDYLIKSAGKAINKINHITR